MSGYRDTFPRLGLIGWISVFLALLAWGTVGNWLRHLVGWPEHYGLQCSNRSCANLLHSLVLLQHGDLREIALFCYLWSIPVLPLALFAWFKWRRPRPATFQYPSD